MRLEVCVVNLSVKAVLLNVACTSETACLTHTMVSTSLIYTLSKLQQLTSCYNSAAHRPAVSAS